MRAWILPGKRRLTVGWVDRSWRFQRLYYKARFFLPLVSRHETFELGPRGGRHDHHAICLQWGSLYICFEGKAS